MPSCHNYIKMESLLLSENLLKHVNVVDITKHGGARNLIEQYKVRGFPTFISNKTGKVISGYTDTDSLVKDLLN